MTTKWILENGEQESFDEKKDRFDEVCISIKNRKDELRKLQDKQTKIINSCGIIKININKLTEERDNLERYLIAKHAKSEIFSLNKMELLKELKGMNEKDQYNYLMRNKIAWKLFNEIIFERRNKYDVVK